MERAAELFASSPTPSRARQAGDVRPRLPHDRAIPHLRAADQTKFVTRMKSLEGKDGILTCR